MFISCFKFFGRAGVNEEGRDEEVPGEDCVHQDCAGREEMMNMPRMRKNAPRPGRKNACN